MNHAYRLIFNRALGITQVAAETARSQGKNKQKNTLKTLSRANGVAAAVALMAGVFAIPAMAIDVGSQADWNNAVSAVASAGAGSTVSINFTSGFTLTSSLSQLQATNSNVTVNISGNNQTIDGASTFQGIQISGSNAPTVNISNLAITGTKTVGGAGGAGQNGYYSSGLAYGSGGGGGGGLGAGGGLFVGSGANVTLATVTFTGNNATGGGGGNGGVAQNGASSPTGGNGGEGGTLNGGSTVGGGGAGGTGGNTGTQGTAGSAGTMLGDGGGGGGGSGTTNSTSYTPNNSGGLGANGGGRGGSDGDGVTNNNGSQGPGADGGYGGSGGGAQGGAIYVATGGSLTILDTAISGATTTGGAGGSQGVGQGPSSINGSPGSAGVAEGAGIYLSGVTANIGVSNGALTYANTIGGTGSTTGLVTTALNKTGNGILALTGVNTFVGDVKISAGTLSIAASNNLGNSNNDVVMADGSTLAVTATSTFASGRAFKLNGLSTFDIAGGTTSTIQGVISDGTSSGSLVKTNTGKLVLSGANTYTGQTTVAAGTLALTGNSTLAHSSGVRVASGATLDLSAVAPQSINTLSGGGTVALGSKTLTSNTLDLGMDTLTVQGNLANTGRLNTSVASNNSYGKVNATGTVHLDGTLAVNVIGSPALSGGLTSVIHADNGISGTFSQVTDNSVLFDFAPLYRQNDVDLNISTSSASNNSVTSIVRGHHNNPAMAAAQVLDANFASHPDGELASAFRPLTTEAEVNSAVTQTLPLLTGGASTAITGTLSSINNVVQARQDSNSGLSGGDLTSDNHAWLKTFGSWADQDDNKGVSGFDANTTGLAIGTDAAFTEQLRLGVAFVYAKTDVDSNSSIAPQSLEVDTYQLVGYGSYSLQPDTELNFQVDAGQHNNEGKRHMPFADATAKADYSSQSAHIGVGLGHSLHFSEQLTFVPSVRADYTWIGDEGYREKGAGALDLKVDRQDAEQFILSADGKLNYDLSEHTVLSANLGAGYDLINEQSSITSTYAGAANAAFTTRGLDPSPWLERGGLGLTHTLDNGTEISLRYDVESRSDFLNQSAALKARWAF